VPEAAISPLGGEEALVWTVPPGSDRLAQREIVLGAASREGHREVLAGLKPGQVVVLDPNPDFREGQRVRPRRR
jgi:multidrug efflux pump subunit AcrA (membrane-fusion protein)